MPKLFEPKDIQPEFQFIELQNGKKAILYQALLTKVAEIDPKNEIMVYKYKTPCPVCGYENPAFSYDGKVFSNIQLNCRYCGIFYRPIIKRD